MRFTPTSIILSTLLAGFASAQAPNPRYTVTDLGTLPGGSFSQATFVNDSGIVGGFSTAADGTAHAVVWLNGHIVDVSTPGLGGPNSGTGSVNEFGLILAGGETTAKDPNNENFCGNGDGLICKPYVLAYGTVIPLPLLGGNNGSWGGMNNLAQVAGYSETSVKDNACPTGPLGNGNGPQVLDYEPVIWGPRQGAVRKLALLPGDTVGVATAINDFGQAVGISGTCANTVPPPFNAGPHAVLWEADGSVHDLKNLGGTGNPALTAIGNSAVGINNRGQVTGGSALAGNTKIHPFLWTKAKGMQDLNVLTGDDLGSGLAINNRGDIVGASISGTGPLTGSPRAFLYQNGNMNDLNSLVPSDAPLYLLTAFSINDFGEIAGFGVSSTGDVHAFVATPCESCTHAMTEKTRIPYPAKLRRFLHW